MRRLTVWMATITIVAVLLNAGAVRHALSDEPTAPTTSAETPQSAAEPAMNAAEAVPPVVEGQPGPPAEAGDIQERGLHQGTTPGRPQGGKASGPPSNFQAPTPSLTAVANAIRVTSKSVSVNLRVPANAPVTVPVEISVAYISPVRAARLTKTYAPSTGTVILYHETEGDRKPRSMRLDISLRELIPNDKTFSFSRQFTVIPLFDVTISPLVFSLFNICEIVGNSDIFLRWSSPEHRGMESKFDIGLERKVIREFAWDVKGISTEANLSEPLVIFDERDLGAQYTPPLLSGESLLLPGRPTRYSFILKEGDYGPPGSPPGSTECQANFLYNIDRKLLTFDSF